MKNFYFLLLIVFVSWNATSQIVNIPDANFKATLLSSAIDNTIAQDVDHNNIKIDANNNGEIEVSEALLVYRLFYPSSSGPPPFRMASTEVIGPISDITGIAAFANLEYLNLGNNELVTADFSSNTALSQLLCNNNLLTSINLSGLVNLTYLNIRNNFLTGFSTAGFPALITVDCGVNPIATLIFDNNPALQNVYCQLCDLTSLDVSGLSSLKRLQCGSNDISSLNFGTISQVTDLGCSNNQLTVLDISNLDQLKTLGCDYNMIATNLDFSDKPEIISVNCSNNQITSLLFANNYHLDSVASNNNNLSSLDFSSTSLYTLFANNNPNLAFVNVKNGVVTPDIYVSQFPEPPFTRDNFQLQNTNLDYICHDEGEFGDVLVANQGLENISRGTYCSFTPGGDFNTISGAVRFDCGGLNSVVTNFSINIVGDSQSGTTFSNGNGSYQFYSAASAVSVTPQIANPNYFVISPPDYNFSFSDFGNTQIADFCLSPNGFHPDLAVSILPITAARPGFDAVYKIIVVNNGNQMQSGAVALSFDDAVLDFISSIPNPNSQSGNSLSWDFTNLAPLESREIQFTLNVNSPVETPAVNIGDVLTYNATVTSTQTDETPSDNQITYNQTVIGAFDPNDKEVIEGSEISIARIGDYLHYVIRFQNMGTASAENVVIRDILSDNLDWSSLQMLSGSHPFRSTLTAGNKLEIFYENINLPAMSVNEPGSHGYVAFKIKPKTALVVNDIIENNADIFFDYNLPVQTNTVATLIGPLLSIPSNGIHLFKVYPNPTSGTIHIEVADNQTITKACINNLLGQTIMVFENPTTFNIGSLTKGTYFITVEADSGRETQKIIKF